MEHRASFLVSVACDAVDSGKLGRFRTCIEQLLQKHQVGGEVDFREDPGFGLLVPIERAIGHRRDAQIRRAGVKALRELRKNSVGKLRELCDSRLQWLLTCASCRAEDPELKSKLSIEAESVAWTIQAEICPRDFTALWHWAHYWHKKYDESWYFDCYLYCHFSKKLEDVFQRMNPKVRTMKNFGDSFLFRTEPIEDLPTLKRVFEDHVRTLAGPEAFV